MKFIYAFILTRSSLGLLHVFFSHICTRVMALDLLQNLVSAQYLENKWTDFDQTLYKTIFTDKICVAIVSCHFLHICTAVYHKRGNHTVTLYEKRVKMRYYLRGSPLG